MTDLVTFEELIRARANERLDQDIRDTFRKTRDYAFNSYIGTMGFIKSLELKQIMN